MNILITLGPFDFGNDEHWLWLVDVTLFSLLPLADGGVVTNEVGVVWSSVGKEPLSDVAQVT